MDTGNPFALLSCAPGAPDLTAEQLRSTVGAGEAALIGPRGVVLPVADGVTVGRDPAACEVAVLHPSVSCVHARIERAGDGWAIVDLDSRNGTTVDGAVAAPGAPAALGRGARIGLGAAALWFWPAPLAAPPRRRRRETAPADGQGGLRVALGGGVTVELVERRDGGIVRTPDGAVAVSARELALLRALAARRRDVRDPEWAYVGAAELAAALGFRSVAADGDNVRELVCRVRRKLAAGGLGRLVEGRRGAGYRLAG